MFKLPATVTWRFFFSHDAPAGQELWTIPARRLCYLTCLVLSEPADAAAGHLWIDGTADRVSRALHTYAENVVAGVGFDEQEYSA